MSVRECEVRSEIWEQWDRQDEIRRNRVASDLAYVELNNLYLFLQSGVARMSIYNKNLLYKLLSQAYPDEGYMEESIREWWVGEFRRLPNWFDF